MLMLMAGYDKRGWLMDDTSSTTVTTGILQLLQNAKNSAASRWFYEQLNG